MRPLWAEEIGKEKRKISAEKKWKKERGKEERTAVEGDRFRSEILESRRCGIDRLP